MTTASDPAPYRVLVVCTGNICRSPFAERLLRAACARISIATADPGWLTGVEVTSAGTHAMVGRPIEPAMRIFLDVYPADTSEHAARQLDVDLLDQADLVLGLTRAHRRDIVWLKPSASRKVFAMNEFARLLEDAAASGAIEVEADAAAAAAMRTIGEAVAGRRGYAVVPEHVEIDDVADPYGRDDTAYRESAARIAEIVARIEAVILDVVGPRT